MRPTKQAFLNRLNEASKSGVMPGYNPPLRGGKELPGCVYLAADGRQCGIGCHIPRTPENTKYLEHGGAVNELLGTYPKAWEFFPEDMSVGDLRDVQCTHDAIAIGLAGVGWDHELFMKEILALPCFISMAPEEL